MKTTTILAILTACTIAVSAQTELIAPIKKVTIYEQGAQIERSGELQLQKGTHNLVLKNVSPVLSKDRIKVSASSDVMILAVSYEIPEHKPEISTQEIETRSKRLKQVELLLEKLYSEKDILRAEEGIINTLRHPEKLKTETTIDDIIKAQAALREKLQPIRNRLFEIVSEEEKLNQEKNKLQQEIKALNEPKAAFANHISVRVKVEKPSKTEFRISYDVHAAKWLPVYDVRVKDANSPLNLHYNAIVSQQSGEDWNNVKLVLATGNPQENSNKPQLKPWYVNQGTPYERKKTNQERFMGQTHATITGRVTDSYGEPLPFATLIIPGTSIGTTTDLEGRYSLTLPPDARQIKASYIGHTDLLTDITGTRMDFSLPAEAVLSEVQVVSHKVSLLSPNNTGATTLNASGAMVTRDDITTMPNRSIRSAASVTSSGSFAINQSPEPYRADAEFEITEQYSIAANGKTTTIPIKQIDMAVSYQYYCAPKLDKDVFLTALVTDWERHHLLEGQTHIYYEGTYVGSGLLDTRFVKDTIDISLGRDRSVQALREKIKDANRNRSNDKEAVASRNWQINIRNNKIYPIRLIVEDQVPLTSDQRVQIKSDIPTEATLNAENGYIKWQLSIEPSQRYELKFGYTVRYPSNWNLNVE